MFIKSEFVEAALSLKLTLLPGAEINPGDLYLAKKNTEVKLLQCKKVCGTFIVPIKMDYCYNTCDAMAIKQ